MTVENKAYRLLDSKLRNFLGKESNKWDAQKSWRWPSVCYTLEHKMAFAACEYYFTGRCSCRGIFHDWEKPWMYMFPWLKEGEIQRLHRQNNPHHMEAEKFSSIPHLVEMYIDWECAAITKPDKPLNAFDTLLHFYPAYIKYMLPVCLVFNVKSVRSNVWLHSWHDLAKNDARNAEIFANVLSVLKQMSDASYTKEWAVELKKKYDLGKSIAQFKPEEIFMLTLLWHSEVMKFDIDYNITNGVIDQVYSDMRKYTHFTHSGVSGAICDIKNVKPSTYRV